MRLPAFFLAASVALLAVPALAASSVSFPFKGSDNTTYTGQTIPTDGNGNVPMAAPNGLPLPTGAALSAKQPALGTAGTPAADVISVQGIPGGTPQPADTVVRGTPTSRSGSITTGGTAQQLMAANTARRGWRIQNLSTGDLYVNELGTASAAGDSMKVPAGALYETPPQFVSTGAISIFGATTNQLFYAREF